MKAQNHKLSNKIYKHIKRMNLRIMILTKINNKQIIKLIIKINNKQILELIMQIKTLIIDINYKILNIACLNMIKINITRIKISNIKFIKITIIINPKINKSMKQIKLNNNQIVKPSFQIYNKLIKITTKLYKIKITVILI